MACYMYVSLQDDDKIAVFTMDAGTGKLTPTREIPVPGGPSPLAISPDRSVLYVGHRGSAAISSFRIDQDTGGLRQHGKVALEAAPTFLATDRTGRFVLSAYDQGAHAAVHPVGADGRVGDPAVVWLETATGAHAMQTDRSNRFAFVPHIAGNGPNAIFQFRFDERTGQLTPNSPPRVEPEAYLGPRHFCFHPTQDLLYFSNEQGSSVTGYRLGPVTGTRSAFQTITTLPAGYTDRNTCSQIQIAASGKFLYAPNRGHNSIVGFAVDPATGRLTAIGHVSTEPVPSAFSQDPEGQILFAAGNQSGRLASYRINGEMGVLTPPGDVCRRPAAHVGADDTSRWLASAVAFVEGDGAGCPAWRARPWPMVPLMERGLSRREIVRAERSTDHAA
jgi:6-phosphogluconolactonase